MKPKRLARDSRHITVAAIGLMLVACGSEAPATGNTAIAAGAAVAQAPITGAQAFAEKPFVATPIATFQSPWALAFLPDGRMLVTEKAGTMLLVSADGKTRVALAGIPAVDSDKQGALGEVALDPDFAGNKLVYFSFSEAAGEEKGIALVRGRLAEDGAGGARLDDVRILYRAHPKVTGGGHYAGRIAFSSDGHLFFSAGERQKFDPAQDPRATLGKVLRLDPDGRPAEGNPLAAEGFDPAVWSYGHRNPLGLAFDGQGRLWEVEMGARGGDELNLVLPGRNYGWPLVSNGDHYDGKVIPDHPTRPDLEAPKTSWNPSISPSSLLFYSGTMFPEWRGNAFISALSGQALLRIAIDGDTAREAARYAMNARIRAVDQGPDGALYVLEDGPDGRLLRLTPKQ